MLSVVQLFNIPETGFAGKSTLFLWIFFTFDQIISLDFFIFRRIICLDNFFFVYLHPDNQTVICITKELLIGI